MFTVHLTCHLIQCQNYNNLDLVSQALPFANLLFNAGIYFISWNITNCAHWELFHFYRVHEDGQAYYCVPCDYVTSSLLAFKEHITEHPGDVDTHSYGCIACRQDFSDLHDLQSHMKVNTCAFILELSPPYFWKKLVKTVYTCMCLLRWCVWVSVKSHVLRS